MNIQSIHARQVLNALGNPTIETTISLDEKSKGIATVPAGTSVSSYEAVDLHDTDNPYLQGKGVLQAIDHIHNIIAPALIGKDATRQQDIDNTMLLLDGTAHKAKLGGNAILSVSIAVAKAAAQATDLSLYTYFAQLADKNKPTCIPTPLFNILNGGKHAPGGPDFQEFIILPDTKKTYHEALDMAMTIYWSLKKILQTNKLSVLLGDEGGFAPVLSSNTNALEMIKQAMQETSYILGKDVFMGMDVASMSFYEESTKTYTLKDKGKILPEQLITYFDELLEQFPIRYLEDPLAEDDWASWEQAAKLIGNKTMLVGDDLVSTNPERLQQAIDTKVLTGVIIKPNQIGTISETINVVKKAQQANLKIVVSHRSGETNDDFIADFAVGVQADYAKFGAPARGERVAKYNRLLQIEEDLTTKK